MKKVTMGALIAMSATALYGTRLDIKPSTLFEKPLPFEKSGIGFEMINKS